jgi:hypothetical protein
MGNGVFQTVVDQRADGRQRAALEAISHGRETEPGTLIWQVFSATVSKLLPTQYKPIDLDIDLEQRNASLHLPGIVDGSASSILNPVTGQQHKVQVKLPNGFEFTEAEFVSGKAKAPGEIRLDFDGTHAHLARVHWSTRGVVR